MINKLISINTQGLKSNHVYINSLIKDYQIIFICEHWLLNAEKYIIENVAKSTHDIFFTAAEKGASGRAFGGNCLLVKHTTAKHQIIHEDKHIVALRTILDGVPLLIIGIYLTSYHNKQSLTDYNDQLSIITSILKSNAGEFEPVIIGDFNSFPDDIYDNYARASMKRNPLALPLKNFLISNNLRLFDVTDGEGPSITYRHVSLPNSSYIDHIAVLEDTSLELENCVIHHPEAYNNSDHTPVSVNMKYEIVPTLDNVVEESTPRTLQKWVWKDISFVQTYQSLLEDRFDDLKVPMVFMYTNTIIMV